MESQIPKATTPDMQHETRPKVCRPKSASKDQSLAPQKKPMLRKFVIFRQPVITPPKGRERHEGGSRADLLRI
jgi:hypothetical protein